VGSSLAWSSLVPGNNSAQELLVAALDFKGPTVVHLMLGLLAENAASSVL